MNKTLAGLGIIFCVILTVTLNPAIASAGDDPESGIGTAYLLETAYQNNPRISAARSEWMASLQNYPEARSLPDPVLNTSWFIEPIETRNGSNDFGFQLMQMIPNPKKLSLKGKKALKMAEMSQVKFEKTVLNELSALMNSYYEIGYLNESIAILERNNELFGKMVEIAKIENTSGNLASINLYQAETRLAQSDYELMLLEELRTNEKYKLEKYLGREVDFDISTINLPELVTVEIDDSSIMAVAEENRPEYAMAEISLESAGLDLSMSNTLTQPDFSIGFMYNSIGRSPMSDGMFTSGDDAYGVMFGVSIPIWSGKNRARIQKAESSLEAAKENLDSQRDLIKSDVANALFKLNNSRRLAELYTDVLYPQAVSANQSALSLFESNQSSYSQLLETQLVSQNIEIASLRATADYYIALVDLAKVVGVPSWSFNIDDPVIEEPEL